MRFQNLQVIWLFQILLWVIMKKLKIFISENLFQARKMFLLIALFIYVLNHVKQTNMFVPILGSPWLSGDLDITNLFIGWNYLIGTIWICLSSNIWLLNETNGYPLKIRVVIASGWELEGCGVKPATPPCNLKPKVAPITKISAFDEIKIQKEYFKKTSKPNF